MLDKGRTGRRWDGAGQRGEGEGEGGVGLVERGNEKERVGHNELEKVKWS